MPTRQANGAKFPALTAGQISVLKYHNLIAGRLKTAPHGVYRSLVIRGYLRPCRSGYELTPEGKAQVARIVVET